MDDQDALEFFKSYEMATRALDAARLASHYAEPYTSFTLGHVGVFATRDEAVVAVTPHLRRLKEFGLDDVRLVHLDVTRVSESFRLCLPTWEMRPRNGGAAFTFLNVYGLRIDAHGRRFEFSVADNEALALAERFPGAMPLVRPSGREPA